MGLELASLHFLGTVFVPKLSLCSRWPRGLPRQHGSFGGREADGQLCQLQARHPSSGVSAGCHPCDPCIL